jgi:hypothetical protein
MNAAGDTIGDIVTLTITLDDIEPRIWRRLEVPAAYRLDELHRAVNAAMGWLDYHLHEFEIGGRRYGMPDVDISTEADRTLPEENTVIGDLAHAGQQHLAYWYDFGDDWWHTIEIESTDPAQKGVFYPRCTGGAGACPPEDCGGLPGFEEFKEAMADHRHPSHADLKEWHGGDFDPAAFSFEETSKLLRQVATGKLPENWG